MYYKPAKYIIIIFVFFTSQMCFSQHLTFQDLKNLYHENTERNSTILYEKGFVFKNSKKDINKLEQLLWMYNRDGSNTSSEYFTKDCTNLFLNKCEKVTYMTSSEKHFVALKKSMQLNFYKFLFSNTNENGVLSHQYLIPGPITATFSTIPLNPRVYVIELEYLEVKEEK